jgi:cysteine desulfurase/selenocysteine lyase
MPRIYLDNAATSWPKPEAVYRAVERYQRVLGAPAGRSAYAEAAEVSQAIEAARQAVARLIGARDSRQIVFTANGTDALNLAIHGVLQPGDHVVTSVVEHNSVLRPLRQLEEHGGISVSRVGCDYRGVVSADAIAAATGPRTALIVLTHASNVTGALQPVEAVARLAAARGALFLVDAAQSLGHVEIDVERLGCDLLAAPGHKGLLGPLGTGLLYVRPGVEARLSSRRQGGTGSLSDDDHQPDHLPDKYEAGNLNAAGIVGLGAGVRYLLERGLDNVRRHERELTAQLVEGLAEIPGVTLYGPDDLDSRVGVVSCTLEGFDPQELAALLDTSFHVQVRAGLHCAPLLHCALGTVERGGTVRFSIGPMNDATEIDTAIDAMRQIAAATVAASPGDAR